MDLTGIVKSIDPTQPVQSDHGQNSLLLADFLCITSIPNDNILDCTKLKAFADVKLNDAKMMISLFYRVENIVGKEKMLVTSIFSFSLNVFQSVLSWGSLKVRVA